MKRKKVIKEKKVINSCFTFFAADFLKKINKFPENMQ
jgi:hypothetical protein